MSKPKNTTLLALTTAALSLPGYTGKAQAWADPESDAGYRFSFYDEASLPGSATNGLDGERYQVISNQFHLLMPRGEEWDLNADFTVETMSGASPWYIVPGDDGRPIQIMSGATIDDTRVAVQGRARQYRELGKHSATLGVSKEDDYLALSGGIEADWDINQRRNTVTAGLGYSHDTLEPTDGQSERFPTRIADADKDTITAYGGITHALNPWTIAQLSLSYTYSDGYLSDPYKQAYVAGSILPDARPDQRNQLAVTAKLRHYIQPWKAAIHLDGRYFEDDWGFGADTVELAWHQKLPQAWKVIPSLRWYEQGRADFYRPYYTVARQDGHYSSDYRLSAYGAVSARLGAEKGWRGWSMAFALEHYDSDGDYAVRSVDQENPGIVDFLVVSAAVSYRWKSQLDITPAPRNPDAPEVVAPEMAPQADDSGAAP